MHMPEASVDKYYCMVFPEHNIWCPRQCIDIETIAKSGRKEAFPYGHLRLCVLAADMRHAHMPLFFCHPVCHDCRLFSKIVVGHFTAIGAIADLAAITANIVPSFIRLYSLY